MTSNNTPARPAVAYRSPGTRTLYCLTCARQGTGWRPVTDPAPDAVCDFCGGRVHAVASRTFGAAVARCLSDEDPARIDQLRPEFVQHAGVEAIDIQIRRARLQAGRWAARERNLALLRTERLAQIEAGTWPATDAASGA